MSGPTLSCNYGKIKDLSLSEESTDDAGIIMGNFFGEHHGFRIRVLFGTRKTNCPKCVVLTPGAAFLTRRPPDPVILGFTDLSENGFEIMGFAQRTDRLDDICSYMIVA
jgi:hypothetical protein